MSSTSSRSAITTNYDARLDASLIHAGHEPKNNRCCCRRSTTACSSSFRSRADVDRRVRSRAGVDRRVVVRCETANDARVGDGGRDTPTSVCLPRRPSPALRPPFVRPVLARCGPSRSCVVGHKQAAHIAAHASSHMSVKAQG